MAGGNCARLTAGEKDEELRKAPRVNGSARALVRRDATGDVTIRGIASRRRAAAGPCSAVLRDVTHYYIGEAEQFAATNSVTTRLSHTTDPADGEPRSPSR
jgi:hypothetical protein